MTEPLAEPKPQHHEHPDAARLAPMIEAVLLTAGKPVPLLRLGQALGLIAIEEPEQQPVSAADVVIKPKKKKRADAGVKPEELIAAAVDSLNRDYESTGRAFRIEPVAGGYRLMTLQQYRGVITQYHGLHASNRLSKAAIETLAIIAYRQPITRAKLEAVRGVACGEVLRSLMEKRLVTITGRAEELGRPMLYGTTRQFLEAFGLASVKDLPSTQDFATLKRQ